jgi:radical SAM protein with 4Fe4S-binding SPASM domain
MNPLFRKVHNNLPVFIIESDEYAILYTPGDYIKISKDGISRISHLLDCPENITNLQARREIMKLSDTAREIKKKWEYLAVRPFRNKCLTIHTGIECNQDCSYCYSKNAKYLNNRITGFPVPAFIEAAFRHMAENRDKEDKRLTVVFHGSGEPTIHWQKICDAFRSVTSMGEKYGIKIFTYLATNGCIDEYQADWLARNIDLIGISCDGPSDISEKQRARDNNRFLPVKKVCERIISRGGKFITRTTITRNTLSRQEEIAGFLIEELNAREIHFEPVYLAGRSGFKAGDAETFSGHLINAGEYAFSHGAVLVYSGVRLNELHGPYCDVLRDTIRITPDGLSRNCFCNMAVNEQLITGWFDEHVSDLKISHSLQKMKAGALSIPKECTECINIYHCSRGCPEFCIYSQNSKSGKPDTFRCRLNQLITVKRLMELAGNQPAVSLSDG